MAQYGEATAADDEPLPPAFRLARNMYRAQIGDIVRRSLPLAIGTIAILHEYDFLKSSWWMWGWLLMFGLVQLSDIYLRGLQTEKQAQELDRIHESFSGSIDDLTRCVVASPTRRLTEDSAKPLVRSLLARIKWYAKHVLGVEPGNRIRVTLAVLDRSAAEPHLRVWCYDEPYADRRWTVLPIDGPGAGAAFRYGRAQSLDDVRSVADDRDRFSREFRSVLSIPVQSGLDQGPIAVVNLDSTQAGFFTPARVKRILPLVTPAIKVMALILVMRADGEVYAYHS